MTDNECQVADDVAPMHAWRLVRNGCNHEALDHTTIYRRTDSGLLRLARCRICEATCPHTDSPQGRGACA